MKKLILISAAAAILAGCTVTQAIIDQFSVVYPDGISFESGSTVAAPDSVTIDGVVYSKDFSEEFDGTESEKRARIEAEWELYHTVAVTSIKTPTMLDYSKEDYLDVQASVLKVSELNEEDKTLADGAAKYIEGEYVLGSGDMQLDKQYQYGYIEARIRIRKKTKGHWYYFYTIGSASLNEGYQGTYEYDIIEYTSTSNRFQCVAHWTQTSPEYKTYPKNNFFVDAGDITEWHTYGMLWTEEHVIYYLDGVPYFAFDSSGSGTPSIRYEKFGFSPVADQPMHIKIGNTIANGHLPFETWIGSKVDAEEMLANGADTLSVDYVARYKTDKMDSMLD